MKQYTVTISEAEEKALLTEMVSVQEWLDNFVHASAGRLILKIVEQTTDWQAKRVPEIERESIVLAAQVESAAERGRREDEKLEQ